MPGATPGQCLPLNGTAGYVDIKLREPLVPAAITFQHIPASLAYDLRSAPRELAVWGFTASPQPRRQWRSTRNSTAAAHVAAGQKLAFVTYDLQETTLQTFALQSQSSISYVRIQVNTFTPHIRSCSCMFKQCGDC